VLLEAALALGFYLLAIPFGYLSRRVKRSSLDPYRKWPLFLGIVHTPVLPLIVFARLAHPVFEFELALVGILLLGHLTGVLAYGRRLALSSSPAALAAEK
jgi:prepilin signal peptidase PulO-like enzyme (type II secretory pathway)